MKHFTAILLLSFSVFLAGCSKPDVKYSDLSPATTAKVSGDNLIIHLGTDLTASACWTILKAKVEFSTIYIAGYRTFREQSCEFKVPLPIDLQSLKVIWIDPDGNEVIVPITK